MCAKKPRAVYNCMVDKEGQDYCRERRNRSPKRRRHKYLDEPLRIRRGRCFLDSLDGAPLSFENIVTIRNLSRDWILSDGLWSNRHRTFDSRSQEWKKLVTWLLSPSVRYKTLGGIDTSRFTPVYWVSATSQFVQWGYRSHLSDWKHSFISMVQRSGI